MIHIPVLLKDVLEMAQNMEFAPLRILDATLGRGGHTQQLLELFPNSTLVALDRDHAAIEYVQEHLRNYIEQGRLQLHRIEFSQFSKETLGCFDFILADLGVSSPQFDLAERGFSFNSVGPLDMRMDHRESFTAAEIINNSEEKELIEIFKKYGEISSPYRVVRAIIHDRKIQPYTTTKELADLIARVEGWRKKGFHPATQYFMALRLIVNNELAVIESALPKFVDALNDKGRVAIITFHSLEDRIVKNIFKDLAQSTGDLINKKVIQATEEEVKINPRARSAKLRVFQKGKSNVTKNKYAQTLSKPYYY